MKFCTKCGAELVDEAVICTKCGRMVENPLKPPTAPIKEATLGAPASQKNPSALLLVSNFVHSLGVALSLFFLFLSVGSPYITAYFTTNKKDYITGVYANYYPNYSLLIPAIILSGVALLFSIVSFVMTLVERHKAERVFSGISRFVIGLISLACAIVLMCN